MGVRGSSLLCVAALVVALFAAWTATPAAADDDFTIVSGSFPTGFFVVIDDVALYGGFFKEQHLNVSINFTGNASTAVQLVASGKGDVTPASFEPVIIGYDKGIRLTSFLARDPQYQYALGVLADSPIRTLADFRGKQIGEYSAGSAAELSTNAMLLGAGLKRSDFSYIPIGNGAQAISALTSGRVAGAAFPGPELRIYEVAANLKFRYFREPIIADSSDVGYVASPATLAAKADVLRRFSRAIVKAAIVCRVNPQLAAKYFVESSGVKVTDDAIAKEAHLLEISTELLPGVNPMSSRIGEMPVRPMRVLAQFMYDNGLTSVVVPAASVVTDQFIGYANDFDHKAFIEQAKAMR
jgi:NitT/TauT family transport system substrate-binding protein